MLGNRAENYLMFVNEKIEEGSNGQFNAETQRARR